MQLAALLFARLFQEFLPLGLRIFGNKRLLVCHKFFHPLLAIGPTIREIDDDPRSLGIFQELQPFAQDLPLVFRIVRSTRRIA